LRISLKLVSILSLLITKFVFTNELFVYLVAERVVNRSPIEEIHRAFQLFDDDNTGKISLNNLKRVARELGETLDDDELQAMIDEFDLDEDGESILICI